MDRNLIAVVKCTPKKHKFRAKITEAKKIRPLFSHLFTNLSVGHMHNKISTRFVVDSDCILQYVFTLEKEIYEFPGQYQTRKYNEMLTSCLLRN